MPKAIAKYTNAPIIAIIRAIINEVLILFFFCCFFCCFLNSFVRFSNSSFIADLSSAPITCDCICSFILMASVIWNSFCFSSASIEVFFSSHDLPTPHSVQTRSSFQLNPPQAQSQWLFLNSGSNTSIVPSIPLLVQISRNCLL